MRRGAWRLPHAAEPTLLDGRLLLAGVSVRALAASAFRGRLLPGRFPRGVVALDYFGDADLLAIAPPPALTVLSLRRDLGQPRTLAALGRAALAIPASALVYASAFENRPGLLRALGERLQILGNGFSEVRPARDPAVFFPFLASQGIAHPPTFPESDEAPHRGAGRYLWKPRRSGGGAGVRRAASGERRPPGHYLQAFLPGSPGSAIALAGAGWSVVLGVTEQLSGFRELGARGFCYGGSVAGAPERLLSEAELKTLESAASAIARRFGLRGLFGLDFVRSGGAPAILEVNPRYTASMELLEEIAGASFFDFHLEALRGSPPPNVVRGPAGSDASRFLAKGILYADRPTRSHAEPAALSELGCRDIPRRGEVLDAGQPILTIVVAGASPPACRRRLVEQARAVRRLLDPPGTVDQPRALRRRRDRGKLPPILTR